MLSLGGAPASALADQLFLKDGSLLKGEVVSLGDGIVRIETSYAGDLTIPLESVAGIDLKRQAVVLLEGEQEKAGTLTFHPESGQALAPAEGDPIPVRVSDILGLAFQSESARARADSGEQPAPQAKTAETGKPLQEKRARKWSAKVEGGFRGARGNTERVAIQGRSEVRHEAGGFRKILTLEGNFVEEDGRQRQNEVLGGLRLEKDVSERWLTFGEVSAEHDAFEQLDLRLIATAGMGYFLIRQKREVLKASFGAGVKQENFTSGAKDSQGVVTLGYEYRRDLNSYLKFVNTLKFDPTFSDPFGDFRLDGRASLEIALARSSKWSVRVGIRNQYDSSPQPGVKKLDTTYFINFGYSFNR